MRALWRVQIYEMNPRVRMRKNVIQGTGYKPEPALKVKDKIFYHIHVLGKGYDELWREGSQFIIGDKKNFFLDYYDNAKIGVHFVEGATIPLLHLYNALDEFKPQLREQVKNTWIPQAAKTIKEMGKYIREVIFEEIRVNEFPELPSRFRCIWLAEKKDIKMWLEKIHAGDNEIFKVSVSGKIHIANEKFLAWDTLSHNELRQKAREYWRGKELDDDSLKEILFEGDVTLVEKCDLELFDDG